MAKKTTKAKRKSVETATRHLGVQAGVQASLDKKEAAMLHACASGDAPSKALQASAGYIGRTRSFEQRLGGLLAEGLLAMTVPDKPRSPAQRYRLTEKGIAALEHTVEGRGGEQA